MLLLSRSLQSNRGQGDKHYDKDVHQVLGEQKEQGGWGGI